MLKPPIKFRYTPASANQSYNIVLLVPRYALTFIRVLYPTVVMVKEESVWARPQVSLLQQHRQAPHAALDKAQHLRAS
jgi:hypothetical protein